MQAKANAAMYKAHVPHVYTHQTPYVYNHQTPYVYNYNPVVYKAPEVKAPAVTYAVPVTYTHQVAAPVIYTNHEQVAAPVTYTTPFTHQSMVYNAPAYVPTFHSLHKREAEAEAEADPQVFYNTYGYYPQGYTAPVYTQQVAPVVYTNVVKQTPAQDRKVEQPAVTYTYPVAPLTYTAPVTYTKTVNPVVYKHKAPVTYTHHQVATPVTYTTT